jgi:hypothetical protein
MMFVQAILYIIHFFSSAMSNDMTHHKDCYANLGSLHELFTTFCRAYPANCPHSAIIAPTMYAKFI